ncbi:MAG: HIT domain-containing protein [Proteobacteria bacterium]|nr:HIT domain-containing protein [Pseudomonadota bacterium]
MAGNQNNERLWSPWRMEYILDDKKPGECIFCTKPEDDRDRENLILYRGEKAFIMMNRYPYNNGHLLISPYNHVSDVDSLSDEEMLDISQATKRSVKILKEVMHPEGFNLGINMGKAAGAGIESHIHTHIVPRWNGDTNFMPVIADVRVMPELLDETYMKLYPLFKEM